MSVTDCGGNRPYPVEASDGSVRSDVSGGIMEISSALLNVSSKSQLPLEFRFKFFFQFQAKLCFSSYSRGRFKGTSTVEDYSAGFTGLTNILNSSTLPFEDLPIHSICDIALKRAHEYCSNHHLSWSSLIATHELLGKPCNMGTRNWRQPLQWPIRSIIQIRLMIFINTDAIFKKYTCNDIK